MLSDYKYQIIFGDSNQIIPSTYKIYSNSIDDAYDYIESEYNHIIKKEEWTINRIYSFDLYDSINVLCSEYYNIDCEIKLINPDEIFKTIEFYKDIKIEKKNPKQIIIKSLYIMSIPETNLIKLFEFKNNFSIYQNKYLNILNYVSIENLKGEIHNLRDPKHLSHIEVEKKIIWFLENHFRKKTLNNEIIFNNLTNKTNFILDYNNNNFVFDDDTNIIVSLYNIILN